MKILFVSASYWPAFQFGGPIFSGHLLNKELAKIGASVTVFTTNVGIEDKVAADQETDLDGVKITYFSYCKSLEFLGDTGWQYSLPLALALKRRAREFDILYMLGAWNYPVAIAAYYSRNLHKPYIISPRGLLYPYSLSKKSWKKKIYYSLVAKRDLDNAAAIHYTTEDEKKRCHGSLRLKNKTLVLPHGIDLGIFSQLPSRDSIETMYPQLKGKKVVLFLGRLHEKKGLELLVNAIARLIPTYPDLHLLIAGNGDPAYTARLMTLVRHLAIDANTTFTGLAVYKLKLQLLARADAFVLSSYSENFGVSVIEAMACRIPVIISNQVGLHQEILDADAGIIVKANADAVAEALRRLFNDADYAASLSMRGRRLVESRFDVVKTAKSLLEHLDQIVARPTYKE